MTPRPPRWAQHGAERASSPLGLPAFVAIASASLALAGCPKPAEPERPPTLMVVHADPSVLVTAHPAWREVEEIRSRLREAGTSFAEPSVESSCAPATVDQPPGLTAVPQAGAGALEAKRAVRSGDVELDEIVARGARRSPQLGGPMTAGAEETDAVSAPGVGVALSRGSEDERRRTEAARTRRLASAYADALPPSGRVGVNPAERARIESRLAAAEESAKARARWEAEQTAFANHEPADERDRSEDQRHPPPSATVSPDTVAGRRLDELHSELEREAARLDEFSRRAERSTREAAPVWPSDLPEPEPVLGREQRAPALLEADRSELVERYGDLIARIEAEVRAAAVTVGRTAGYDVRFDGSGPDRTDEMVRLLRRFYTEPAAGVQE